MFHFYTPWKRQKTFVVLKWKNGQKWEKIIKKIIAGSMFSWKLSVTRSSFDLPHTVYVHGRFDWKKIMLWSIYFSTEYVHGRFDWKKIMLWSIYFSTEYVHGRFDWKKDNVVKHLLLNGICSWKIWLKKR